MGAASVPISVLTQPGWAEFTLMLVSFNSCARCMAVSYTHLDVYKRQGERPKTHRNPEWRRAGPSTAIDRQGPDAGPQHRPVIFLSTDGQKQVAQAYIHQIEHAHVFQTPIATGGT